MFNVLRIAMIVGAAGLIFKGASKGFSLKKSGELLTILVSYLGDIRFTSLGVEFAFKLKFSNAHTEAITLKILNLKVLLNQSELAYKIPSVSTITIQPNAESETTKILMQIPYQKLAGAGIITGAFNNTLLKQLQYLVIAEVNGIMVEYRANVSA